MTERRRFKRVRAASSAVFAIWAVFLSDAPTLGAQVDLPAGKNVPLAPRRFTNGLPRDPSFFPLAVWLQQTRNAAAFKAIGINTFLGLPAPPTSRDLAELERVGLYLIVSHTPQTLALKSQVLRGWLQDDEPDNAQPDGHGGFGDCAKPEDIVRRYQEMRAADDTRPILLNFGQAVANPHWAGRGDKCSGIPPETYYPAASAGGDILGFDIYPVAEERQPHVYGRLELVGQGVANLRRWSRPGQAVWNAIETTHIINANRRPLAKEIYSEVWMSLIHGSTGIVYFVHEWKPSFREDAVRRYPEVVAELRRLNLQIKSLAPVLNSPSLVDQVRVSAPTNIATMVKRRANALYVFAVNMEKKPSRASFLLIGLEQSANAAVAIGGERSLKIEKGAFQDEFGDYGVRLYKIPYKQ